MTAEFLVDSIDGVTDNSPLSEQWVGLILLPIVGNAAGRSLFRFIDACLTHVRGYVEHVTAVTVSVKVLNLLSCQVTDGLTCYFRTS